MLTTNDSSQIITLPTRVTQTTSTTIDHILTNDHIRLLTPGVIRTYLSHHFPTLCVVFKHPTTSKPTPVYRRNLRQFDPATYNSELHNNFMSLLTKYTEVTPDNINSVFGDLINIVKNTIDTHAPLKVLSRKQRNLQVKPRITKGILVSIKKKQKTL